MLSVTPDTFGKCLSEAIRARILLLLTRETELCVCELSCALAEIQPKISRHLAQLRSLGVLLDRRQGQWIYYRLSPELPDWIKTNLRSMLEANGHWLYENLQRLQNMADRPSRCC